MNGLLSHTEGLVKSALVCLQDNSNGDGKYSFLVIMKD